MRTGDFIIIGVGVLVLILAVMGWKKGCFASGNALKGCLHIGGAPPPIESIPGAVAASQQKGLGVNVGPQLQCLCQGGKYVGNCPQAGQPCS